MYQLKCKCGKIVERKTNLKKVTCKDCKIKYKNNKMKEYRQAKRGMIEVECVYCHKKIMRAQKRGHSVCNECRAKRKNQYPKKKNSVYLNKNNKPTVWCERCEVEKGYERAKHRFCQRCEGAIKTYERSKNYNFK